MKTTFDGLLKIGQRRHDPINLIWFCSCFSLHISLKKFTLEIKSKIKNMMMQENHHKKYYYDDSTC